jgi:endo-1,4-beta-xylanase
MLNRIVICVFMVWLSTTCKESEIQVPDPVVTEATRLKEVSPFPIGMQCYIGILDFPVPSEAVASNYNAYTSTAFFWTTTQPVPGTFNFEEADKALLFTQDNNLRTHGHALIYWQHTITPDYIKNFDGNKSEFEGVVKNHIQTTVGRYKGKVKSWDVVNEMIDDFKGTRYFNNIAEQFYQNDAAYEEFIGKCFTWAHEADPEAKLFYNEARLELQETTRLQYVIDLAARLQQANIPIHGIGTQMHTDIYCPQQVIDNTLQRLASTGLLIHISELDVSVNSNSNTGEVFNFNTLSTELAEQQKQTYKNIGYAYKHLIPDEQKWGITLWDLMDHTSWLNQFRDEWPCLHDSNCNRKPAYYGLAIGVLKE